MGDTSTTPNGTYQWVPYPYPSWPYEYCTCQRCPCCGKIVAPTAPQFTWTSGTAKG